MKFLLVGINAKYSHTGLGIRSIKYYCEKHGKVVPDLAEFTINQRESEIVRSLYFENADIYLFSCYIWNIQMVKNIIGQLAKIRPNSLIFLGGPEASYKAYDLIDELGFIKGISLGEGEQTTLELVDALETNTPLEEVPGLLLRSGKTHSIPPIDMDTLAFNYPDIDSLGERILYYESMRGCPFSCSYCLSSVESGVRMRSLNLVFSGLERFISAKPRQVKFVDRTFNCDLKRAKEIWKFLIENDNGYTNFHFELAGDILDYDSISLLSKAREGLFQFEIGVQSTNLKTLAEINRLTNLEKLAKNINKLQENKNIHLHLDLIAGLPYENYASFVDSFHWVYSLKPQQFQLGFLKVLGGSNMEKNSKDYSLVYQSNAPFQVLSTKWIRYEELIAIENVEEMIDSYYNSGRFSNTIDFLISHFDKPFDFYSKLFDHYIEMKGEGPLSKIGYYEILGSFAVKHNITVSSLLKTLCRYDIMLHEKPKKYPSWVDENTSENYRQIILDFYNNSQKICNYLPHLSNIEPKQISRITQLEIFEYNPQTLENKTTAILFDYSSRDILGMAKKYIVNLGL